jgi:hypothetical protein
MHLQYGLRMIEERITAGDGTAVVVRTADAASARELEAVGARLHGAAHPGVVQVLASGGTDDGGWVLSTAHGGTPLSAIASIEPLRLAAVGAGAATTLADLHEHGIVHGRLTAARVLLGPHDRPTLCGFGATDPHAGVDDDVAALGRLLLEHLADPGDDRQVGAVVRRMRATLEQAVDPASSRRPSMRRLAAALAELAATPVPVLRRPGAGRDGPSGDGRRLGTWPQLSAVGLAIVVLAVGAARWRTAPATATVGAAAASASASAEVDHGAVVEEREPGDATSTTAAGPALRCALVEGDQPAVEAASLDCPHELALDGTRVVIDGQPFEVGQASDVLAVGSWRCAGDATVALLRPATGEVFVFPAATDVQVTVAPLATVPGATAFRAMGISPRCQELHVLDRSGDPTPLELRPT